MVIDTSAIIAILTAEPETLRLAQVIATDPKRIMSSFSQLEASIVIEARKGESGGRELDLLLHRIKVDIIPLTTEMSQLALEAWRRFGKGRHPAKLNIGDCCAYALAKYSGESLLFKGNDFSQTDINSVIY